MTVLFLLAAVAFVGWLFFSRRGNTGLPAGTVVYDDAGRQHLNRPLVSHRYRRAGRPDYLIKTPGGLVPVELKSTHSPRTGPNEAHVLQLMTYCVLVEDVFGGHVPYGILQYADERREIQYSLAEKRKVLALADEIRATRGAADLHRNHRQAGRCRGCGYRAVCGEALG
jgi:CRISPR-associated exonuclease Cas4